MIIDTHTHLGIFGGKRYTETMLASSMRRAGVRRALVISGKINALRTEHLVRIAERNKKISAIATVSFEKRTRTLERRIAAYFESGKVVGLKLYSGYEHRYPFDKEFFPYYRLCERHDAPVVFHTGDLYGGTSKKTLLKFAHPLHIDEVAVRFPHLNIIIAHLGNPWLIDAAEVMYKNKNVYADISGYVYGAFSKKDRSRFVRNLMDLHQYFGTLRKCLFGSDWPISDQASYVAVAKSLPISRDEKTLLLRENAIKLFHLS